MLIVGSVVFDLITTPKFKNKAALGGSALYGSLAARLFTEVAVIAAVGKDFKKPHRNLFLHKKINIEGVASLAGNTMRWGAEYSKNLETRETLFVKLNVFEKFKPVLSKKHTEEDVIFLGNINPKLQLDVLKQAGKTRFVALDSMDYWIENRNKELRQVLRQVDIFLLNDVEARMFSGLKDLGKCAEKILKIMGGKKKTVIIKKGIGGMLMAQGTNVFTLPAVLLKTPVDPTGAGDTFAGAFLGYLERTKNHTWAAFCRAAVLGTVVASFCVEGFGTSKLQNVTRERIEKRIKEFIKFADLSKNLFT